MKNRAAMKKKYFSAPPALFAGALILSLLLGGCGQGRGEKYFGAVPVEPESSSRPVGPGERADAADYRKAQTLHTALAYRDYLGRYPAGRYAREALHWAERLTFHEAMSRLKPEELKAFLKRYPNSNFATVAQEKLQGAEFERIRKEDTIAAYRPFLAKYKNSPSQWTAAATQRLERLLLDEAKASGKELNLSRFIYDNPKSPYRAEANEALKAAMFERVLTSKDRDEVEAFRRRYKGSEEARAVARHMEDEELRAAERAGSAAALESYLKRYPDTPGKERILTALSMMARDRKGQVRRWVKVKDVEVEVFQPRRCPKCEAAHRIHGTIFSLDPDFSYDLVLEAYLVEGGKRCCRTTHHVKVLFPGEARAFSFGIPGKKTSGPPPAFDIRIKEGSAYRHTEAKGDERPSPGRGLGKKAPADRFAPVPVPPLGR
jgi:outer membrane protein assembly factor BamD (BamD/ComL family)